MADKETLSVKQRIKQCCSLLKQEEHIYKFALSNAAIMWKLMITDEANQNM
jgi:hypothetical protein